METTNNTKVKNNNAKDVSENATKSKYSLLKVFLTFIPILVAIGAYSSDSLFIKFLFSDYKFSVVRATMMGGKETTGFFRSYSTALGELLAPIQILLYLNIRNDSSNPQSIEGILLEFQDNRDSHDWFPVTILHRGNGIYFLMSSTMEDTIELDFKDNNLLDNLGKGKFLPKDIVSGWLFLEFPKEYRKRSMLSCNMRLTIFSGFGEKESHIILPVDLDTNAIQTRAAGLQKTNLKRDLSNLKIMAESDLHQYFEEERNAKKE